MRKLILPLLCFFCLSYISSSNAGYYYAVSVAAGGTITLSDSGQNSVSNSTTATVTSLVVGSGEHIYVFAVNETSPNRTVSTVFWNTDEALTADATSEISVDGLAHGIWYYITNPTATTANIVVTWSDTANVGAAYAYVIAGGGSIEARYENTSTASLTTFDLGAGITTSTSNAWILSGWYWNSASGITVSSWGTGQTNTLNDPAVGDTAGFGTSTEEKASAGADIQTVTISSAQSRWLITSIAIPPA
jgi:hypothetical protein